jgi:nucleoside-diphosphate-sugar epimerase
MRVLLIGGSGFIGPHVADELLRRGHDIAIFHRGSTRGPVFAGDDASRNVEPGRPAGRVTRIVGDRKFLAASTADFREFAPDVVVDLILSSGRQAQELMEVFRGHARRVVVLSSCDVYRACGVLHQLEEGPLQPLPLTETSDLRTALHTYPADQIKALQQVFGWLDDDYDKIPVETAILGDADLPGTVLRLPMVYGPGDRLHRLFPTIKRIDDGRPRILFEEQYAAWRAPRGFVANVGAAIALAATSDCAAGRVYNVAEQETLSELDWSRRIADAAGWRGEFVTLPRDLSPAHLQMPGNLDQHWVVDSTKIRAELGYREAIGREDAIRRTIAWERANPPATVDPRAFDYAAEDSVI